MVRNNNFVQNQNVDDDEVLFDKYMQEPSTVNRNIIVQKYLYLAEIISKKFVNRGIDYEDLYQVSSIALIKAVERFSPDKGVKFVSFATPTIIGELKRFFRDKASVIRIPRRIYELYQKVNLTKEVLSQQLQRAPKVEEIAAELKMSAENVLEIIESWNAYNMQSFDQTVYNDDDLELHETIGEDDISFERIENRDFLEKSLERFNEIEKKFISERYFKNRTQKQIAESLGVSQMYVSRMEKKVVDKFKTILNK